VVFVALDEGGGGTGVLFVALDEGGGGSGVVFVTLDGAETACKIPSIRHPKNRPERRSVIPLA